MEHSNEKVLTIYNNAYNGKIKLAIADTGHGITKDISTKLFIAPINKENTSSGLGIGLLMARLIIESDRGEIQLTETSPSGTTFTIILPQVKDK